MKQSSDIDGVLQTWMADGPATISDRVVDVVAARIGVQRQRRTWPFQRRTTMTKLKLAAALAAAVIVAVVGYNMLPRQAEFGGQSPKPTTVPTPSPTLAPTGSPAPKDLPGGVVAAGRYFMAPFQGPSLRIEFTVPGDGWRGAGPGLASPDGLSAPGGLGMAFLRPNGIFSDPCHWDAAGTGTWPQPADVEVGPTAADLATALAAQTAYESTPVTDVTVGGFAAKRLDVLQPPALDLTTCDGATPAYFVFGASDASGHNLYAQGQGQIWHLWIVEVGEDRLVIVVNAYEGTNPSTLAAAEAIIGSMTLSR